MVVVIEAGRFDAVPRHAVEVALLAAEIFVTRRRAWNLRHRGRPHHAFEGAARVYAAVAPGGVNLPAPLRVVRSRALIETVYHLFPSDGRIITG